MGVYRTRMTHSARKLDVGRAGGKQGEETKAWEGGNSPKGCTLRVRRGAELKVATSQGLQLSTSQRCILLLKTCTKSHPQLTQLFTYMIHTCWQELDLNCWSRVEHFLTAYKLVAEGCMAAPMHAMSASTLVWMLSLLSEAAGQGMHHKIVWTIPCSSTWPARA